MKCALLVAFQFPPFKASSGLERALSLVRHLPAHGWEPVMLSAHPSAYPAVSDERMAAIPADTVVRRTRALDAARHLSLGGRYISAMALPDRWWSWAASAIPAGLALIRHHRPQVIWSTYPIATAHVIGYALSRLSGLPWVADFRDPMVEFDEIEQQWFPPAPALRHLRLRIEQGAARRAAALTFCTEGAKDICVKRYTPSVGHRWQVVPNGFDETAFANLGPTPGARPQPRDAITLVHSGSIYPSPDRDPTHFLRALARLVADRKGRGRPLRVVLRGSGVDSLYVDLISQLGLGESVVFAPMVDYASALREIVDADGLLLLQGHTSNPAIPAKLYEYFRAGRPILGLVDMAGETARCLRHEQFSWMAPLHDEDRIHSELGAFVGQIEDGNARGLHPERAQAYERSAAVKTFAGLFDTVSRR